MILNKLTIIGVGLIGGSFALALKEKGLVHHVYGYGRSIANLETALERGIIDEYSTDIKKAVEDADLVFISVPVLQFKSVFSLLKGLLSEHTVLTDGGSTKLNIVADAKAVFGSEQSFYVPGHPIAGTEKSGANAAFSTLYQDHKVILTPTEYTSDKALKLVKNCWEKIGANIVTMSAEHHDLVLGATSHLPHAIAYTLVNTLSQLHERKEIFDYAAGGFKDFTRIASSNPQMWSDISMANKSSLLEHIEHFQQQLEFLSMALKENDQTAVYELYSKAKNARDQLLQ